MSCIAPEGCCTFRFYASQWKIIRGELTQLSSLVAHISLALTNTTSLSDLHFFPRSVASWTNYVLWQNPTHTKIELEISKTDFLFTSSCHSSGFSVLTCNLTE